MLHCAFCRSSDGNILIHSMYVCEEESAFTKSRIEIFDFTIVGFRCFAFTKLLNDNGDDDHNHCVKRTIHKSIPASRTGLCERRRTSGLGFSTQPRCLQCFQLRNSKQVHSAKVKLLTWYAERACRLSVDDKQRKITCH